MSADFRETMKRQIADNIRRHGRHLYSIQGGESPRYSYTIGMTEKGLPELVLAGCITLPIQAVGNLLNRACKELERIQDPDKVKVAVDGFGSFHLEPVHSSWSRLMLLGAYDHYKTNEITAYQIRPEAEFETIDLPDMWQAYDPGEHRVWQWLDGGWPYRQSSDTWVVTNLDALRGYAISELFRWEEDVWELYSGPGPEVPQAELFAVPLATLLAFDPTLEPVLELEVGTGLFREHDDEGQPGPWEEWRAAGS